MGINFIMPAVRNETKLDGILIIHPIWRTSPNLIKTINKRKTMLVRLPLKDGKFQNGRSG